MKNIISLTKQLISIPSAKDNSTALKRVLDVAEKELAGFPVKRFEKNNIPSLLFYNTSKLPKRFKIILNAHLDVVPGKEEQFEPRVKNEKLYGRGTYDMKSAGAVEILVFKKLAKKVNYPLGLQLVTDEEIGGVNGTKYQIEKGVSADFVITGEPTNLNIGYQSKGVLWTKVFAKGKSAHGAYPWKGKNALWKMKKFLDVLEKEFPPPKKEVWKTTVNLACIETQNKTFNKVPRECTAYLDFRFVPKEKKTILQKLKRLLPEGFKMQICFNDPPYFTDKNNPFLKRLEKITQERTNKAPRLIKRHGASDIRHYTTEKSYGVEFGPSGDGIHSNNEWVDIKSLKTYYQIIHDFVSKSTLNVD